MRRLLLLTMKKIIWVTCKFSIAFIFPILTTWYVYQFEKIEILDVSKYQLANINIPELFPREPSLKDLVSEVLEVPLVFDWYKVSIIYNDYDDPDCIITGTTRLYLNFYKGDPRKYLNTLKETTDETGGYSENPGHPTYFMESGETAYFIAPSWEEYSLDGGLAISQGCEVGILNPSFGPPDPHAMLNFIIYLEPYLPFWIVRFVIIFAIWIAVVSAFVSVYRWVWGR